MNNFYTTNIDRNKFDKMTCVSEEKNVPVLFVSLQTTEINPGEIIQMTVVKTKAVNGQFEIVESYNNYFKPHVPVSKETEIITGLNDDVLSLYAHVEDTREWFNSIFFGDYIVAMYNVQWAKRFMDRLGLNYEIFISPLFWVNIVDLAKCVVNPSEVSDYKNQRLCEVFKVDYSISDNKIKTSGLVKLTNKLLLRYQTKYITSHKAFMPNVLDARFINDPDGVSKVEVNTDNGKLFLLCSNYTWTDEDGISIQFLDIDGVEKFVLETTKTSDLKSFVRLVREKSLIKL